MRTKPWIWVICFCVGLVLVLGAIKAWQIRAAIAFGESFPEPSETVQTERVEYQNWQPRMTLIGEVRASQEVTLRNELAGAITRVGYASGESVESGQLLLQIDISQELAEREAAEAEVALAQTNFDRLSGFNNPDAVSRQRVDQAAAQLAIAKARVKSVQSVIDRKTIRAPFAAKSSLHEWEVGQYLAADTVVARLVGEGDEAWVDFALPQQNAEIALATPVLLSTDANDAPVEAKVIALEGALADTSRTRKVRAAFSIADVALMPGSIVNVSVPVGDADAAVRLVSSAVRVDAFGPYVFLVSRSQDGKDRAKRQPVTVLAKEGEFTYIDGVPEGEQVATLGAFKLRDGVWVKQGDSGTE